MAPTVIGHTTAKSALSGSTITIDPSANVVGSSVATDDWIILIMSSAGTLANTRQPTAGTGWTNLVPLQAPGTGSYTFGVWAYKRASGESTYTWTQSTSESAVLHMRMVFIRGADDIASWITGSLGKRPDTGETLTTTAPSITTITAYTLGLVLAGERTTTTETDSQVTCNNFTKQWFDNDVDHSLFVGTKDMETAGSTGSVTVTYPNAQAQNGIGVILGIAGVATTTPIMWVQGVNT